MPWIISPTPCVEPKWHHWSWWYNSSCYWSQFYFYGPIYGQLTPISVASQTHFCQRGKSLVNCIHKPCPGALYSAVQSHCHILPHDTLHHCLNSLENNKKKSRTCCVYSHWVARRVSSHFVNSHFVNSHFVNSHFVNSHLVNVDKAGIDKMGIDKMGSWQSGNWISTL